MALEIPGDVPSNQFIHAGLMTIDGGLFDGNRRIGTNTLVREIDYVKRHVTKGDLQTSGAWQQVRNVCLAWCFSYRTLMDNKALNAFLKYVGLHNLELPTATVQELFTAIEVRYSQCPLQPLAPVAWIQARPPPQRLPSSNSTNTSAQGSPQPYPQNYQPASFDAHTHSFPPVNPQMSMSGFFDQSSYDHQAAATADLNSNPKYQGRFFFTEHKQEYDGYQFQCIFRCLKDGNHCRKAPVREMNRHLRERHKFRPGFKIAGVDWENKRWRGAGANHEECSGKIVEKDSADDSDDGSEANYVVR